MRAIYVPLTERTREALLALSEREFRDPRDQAALIITEGLRQAGVLAESGPSRHASAASDPQEGAP